jgi:hypothetical protein
VNRYVRELREHLADLITRERAAGLDAHAAEVKARALLGTDPQLAQAMIDRGAPRSLASRAPWAVFGVGPLVALILITALLAKWFMAFFFPYRELTGAALPENIRTIGSVFNLIGSYAIGPALAAACIVIALRQRLSSRWVWTGLALIALISGPLGFNVQFIAPEAGGGIRGSIAQTVFEQGRLNGPATLATIGLRAAVLFVLSALTYGVLKQRVVADRA